MCSFQIRNKKDSKYRVILEIFAIENLLSIFMALKNSYPENQLPDFHENVHQGVYW